MHGLLHSLRIKLRIVDDGIITDLAGDIDANETATPRRVGQQITVIAGRYERGITLQLADSRFVRLAHIEHRLLEYMLQKTLMIGTHLIELVHIDQHEAIEIKLGITLPAKVDAVGIIGSQVGRQEIAAVSGLTTSLRTDQQG